MAGEPAPHDIDPGILAARDFIESPIFAEAVQGGEIPALGERLPDTPLVVKPLVTIGRYGGTLNRALTADVVNKLAITKTLNENLFGFERPMAKRFEKNLAESFEFSADGTALVVKIRKGVRWSIGNTFMVDDILFWYEDMVLNQDARNEPLFPSRWLIDGEPAAMEKIDAHTLKITGRAPLGRILEVLCRDELAVPKHIFAPYHPRYNSKADFEDFRSRTTGARMAYEPGIPRISAWVPVEWVRGRRAVYEHNPYYWKIDTAGNQLPYIGTIHFSIISDEKVILLRFINGELDLIGRHVQNDMFPTLKSHEQSGRFSVRLSGPKPGPGLVLNWDVEKKSLRDAFRDRRVRLAISYAINREEIGETLYFGLMEPAGYSFGRNSEYYSEEALKRYSQFDRARARALLEDAGYPDRDGDGIREDEKLTLSAPGSI